MTLPYFHRDALRERFNEHLQAISDSLEDDQRHWLEQLVTDPDAQSETRLYHLQGVIAANLPVIDLNATVLITRISDPRVFLYHPLLGLSSHPTRSQLKQTLIADLKHASVAQALLHYSDDTHRQRMKAGAVSDFEAVLVEQPLLSTLMVSINDALTRDLGQWQALLQAQPTPHELLDPEATSTGAISEQAMARLDAYWQGPAPGAADAPCKRLARLINTRMLESLTEQAWAGDFDADEQQRICGWLAGETYNATNAQLQAHRIWLQRSNAPHKDLDTLLVLTSHKEAQQICYSYRLSEGWQRFSNYGYLYKSQEDLQRQRNAANMLLAPMSAPVLDWIASALLQEQQARLGRKLTDAEPSARHDACLQALYLEPELDPRLKRIDSLFAPPPPGNARQILELLMKAAQRDANEVDLLDKALKALETRYNDHLQRAPTLVSVTTASLQRRFASLLQQGPSLDSLTLNKTSSSDSATTLQQLTWERLSTPSQALPALVVTGSHALDDQIVRYVLEETSIDLRHALDQALRQHARLEYAIAANLRRLLLSLERTLLAQDSAVPPEVLLLIDSLLQNSSSHVWYLTLDTQQAPQANVLMLSTEEAAEGVLLWTCDQGFCLFDDHQALEQAVLDGLPESMPLTEPALHWARSSIAPLQQLHTLDDQQHQRQTLQAYDRLLGIEMPADRLPGLMQAPLGATSAQRYLQRVQQLTRQLKVRSALPAWFSQAAADQQRQYLQTLALNLMSSPSAEDYLFDIEDIPAYANAVLVEHLDEDFRPGRFHPTAVFITTTRWVSAAPAPGEIPSGQPAARVDHHQSLVDYALNHYRDWDHPITRVELGDYHEAPAELSADYLSRLVRRLDIGAHYQALLKEKFAPSHPNYPRRRLLFCQQQPAQLLERVWRARLKGELSQVAVDMVEQVLSMPEGHLRLPVDGQHVSITPLLLIADPDLAPDHVPGCYLFRKGEAGPLVLYMPFEPSLTLQEFASSEVLLEHLRQDQALQERLLQRMPDATHKRYAHGGFIEPHLKFNTEDDFLAPHRPGPITLGNEAVSGNALHFLFKENIDHLQQMASTQLISNAQVRWNALVNVLSLVWEQVSMFLPGKVGLAVAAWQTEMLTLQIASQLEQRNWQQALVGLTSALVQGAWVVSAIRQQPDFWGELQQDPRYTLSLSGFEAPDQVLDTLHFDSQRRVYGRADTGEHFVTLQGRLYRVRQEEGQWYLVKGALDDPGLLIEQSSQGDWTVIDDQKHPASFNRLKDVARSVARSRAVRDTAAIMAAGTQQIHQNLPAHGRAITRAYQRGVIYLETALANIRRASQIQNASPQTIAILSDFFGVAVVDGNLVQRVRQSLAMLLAVMSSPKFSPSNSNRYVIASTPRPSSITAFVEPYDRFKQIYLLDGFFTSPSYVSAPLRPPYRGRDIKRIYQSCILLHEFSHIACNTRDIQYLDAHASFVELFQAGPVATRLQHLHDYGLSHRTPFGQLFTVYDGATGNYRDITNKDRLGRNFIMTLTQAATLDEARQRFLGNDVIRSQIMLGNADSLTLLIYRLGRTLHP